MLQNTHLTALIIGAGPAGLMAAEQLTNAGYRVDIFDAMPTAGRKLLRAGIGGLNLTHAENKSDFVARYGDKQTQISQWLSTFDADDLRAWAKQLGIDTFVGSSGRVFPIEKKAAPLLRAWLKRLKQNGATLHTRHRWLGWAQENQLLFKNANGEFTVSADVIVFALGGGSWAKLGSDGQWLSEFQSQGIQCVPFRASNIGFEAPWPNTFKAEFAGSPLKSVALSVALPNGTLWRKKGDAVVSTYGIEGSLVYAASAYIRDAIEHASGCEVQGCEVYWDLLPDKTQAQVQNALSQRRKGESVSNLLRKQLKLSPVKMALLKILTDKDQMHDLTQLPALLKKLPQPLTSVRPIDEAISTDGGVAFAELTENLMLHKQPGTFCAGEMLDWEAPTGGYLLTACFASGVVSGQAAVTWLKKKAGINQS